MKSAWLRKEGAEELLIFFNGWGMDERIGAHLLGQTPSEALPQDVLACHDYRSLELEKVVQDELSQYNQITIVAWSFGVWVAQHTELPQVTRAIALNGTLYPVNAEKGIRPDLFQATLATFSEENRQRFNRRMCGSSEALDIFSAMAPDRAVDDQKEELALLKEHFQAHGRTKAAWNYDHAIIGGKDLVFLAQQQYNAWEGTSRTVISDMPHFPFFHFRNLQEVVACIST